MRFDNKVQDLNLWIGCDPEFFLRKGTNGGIIGAEKVIPKKGIEYVPGNYKNLGAQFDGAHTALKGIPNSKFVIDGVQAELNPRPNTCRANLANEISCCFRTLKNTLKDRTEGSVSADFSQTIEISKEELLSLDEKSRQFGCAPSVSAYNNPGVDIKTIDAEEYRVRAAGGHIHLGFESPNDLVYKALKKPEILVPLLDYVLGNTSVLIDRDPGNIERRKLYGKAGEYRTPKHGLEYRTLSNFWLKSYPLMSLVTGLARYCVQMVASSGTKVGYPSKTLPDFPRAFFDTVPQEAIARAIDTNDFDLALENYNKLEELIVSGCGNTDRYVIHENSYKEFRYFFTKVREEGMDFWFPDSPMTHWTNLGEAHVGGMSDFLQGKVRNTMNKDTKYLKKAA